MNSPMKRCILFLSAILLGVCGATDGWILHAESTAYEHEIRLTRARREAYQDVMSLRVRGVMEFKSVWDVVSAEARELGKAVNTPVTAINIKASADELLNVGPAAEVEIWGAKGGKMQGRLVERPLNKDEWVEIDTWE